MNTKTEAKKKLDEVSMEMTGKKYAELEDDGVLQDNVMHAYEKERGLPPIKAKHTPTPWAVDLNKYITCKDGTLAVCVYDSKGNDPCKTMEEARANAAFIVHAVNAHEDLIRAAIRIERLFATYENLPELDGALTQLRAALRKAGQA